MVQALQAWRRWCLALALALVAGPVGCSLLVNNNLDGKPEEGASGGAGAAGSGAMAGGTGGGAAGCEGQCAPSSCCGGACVDLATNEAHCGACGAGCLAGRTCEGAACGPGWASMSTAGAPTPRVRPAAAWIDRGMFVWGGRDEASDRADGGIYDPATDTWLPVTEEGAPTARVGAAAVWTGEKVIVFGGGPTGTLNGFASGGQYDPASATWLPISLPNPPTGRRLPIAVWTGSRMLIWGGESNNAPLAGGALYNPADDAWSDMSKGGDPSARVGAAWAWTGDKLLLFGGRIGGMGATNEGYVYEPASDTWTEMSSSGAPSPRYDAFAVWMGDGGGAGELLVWGGRDENDDDLDSGARYDPAKNEWLPASSAGAPAARSAPGGRSGVAGWTGLRAIVVGGLDGMSSEKNGGQYDRGGDDWPVKIPPWPSGDDHQLGAAVWSGREIIVWSGLDGGALIAGGERYMP